MRINRNQSAANVKAMPFDKRQVNAVCRKVGIPRRDWACFLMLVNQNTFRSETFHRKVDYQFDYRLALLVITGLLRFA